MAPCGFREGRRCWIRAGIPHEHACGGASGHPSGVAPEPGGARPGDPGAGRSRGLAPARHHQNGLGGEVVKIPTERVVESVLNEDRDGLSRLVDARFADPSLLLERVNEALHRLGQQLLPDLARDDEISLRYGFLRALQDERASRSAWRHLLDATAPEGSRRDKDRILFDLWKSLEKEIPACPYGSVGEHRRHFLLWFLRRYDLGSARRLYWDSRLAPAAQYILLGLLAALLVATALLPQREPFWWGPLAVYGAVCGWLGLAMGDGFAALNSLVPRLLGTVAVGLAILCSSSELASVVLCGRSPEATCPPNAWIFIGTVVVSWLYLLLESERRIYPRPPTLVLCRRSFAILCTGLSHALALAVAFRPALRATLGAAHLPAGCGAPWLEILNVTGFILIVGMLFQIIWAEEPVTHPL